MGLSYMYIYIYIYIYKTNFIARQYGITKGQKKLLRYQQDEKKMQINL